MGSLDMKYCWEMTTWGELVELKYGKSLKGYRESGGRYPVYGTNGLVGWTEKPLCEFPSVIVGRKGAYRGVHFSDSPFFVIDTAFYVNPKPGVSINLKWAYYALLLADINGMDSGSAIPSTSREDFYALSAHLPPLAVQGSIVKQLDALNNKIELNRQINATLESMAQAMFKSWFVDFDPVIDNALAAGNPIPEPFQARAEKRAALLAAASAADTRSASATDNAHPTQTAPHAQPGTTPPATPLQPLPADLRALFPDSFVFDEEMGWVPEGWPVGLLDEISHYGSERISVGEIGHANYVSTENLIPERGGVREASSLPTSEWVPAFTDGSILVSNIRPYFKKIWLARGVGGRSNDVLGFESKLDGAEEYLYCLLNQDKFFDYMMATAKGTKMPRGDKKAIMNWPVIIPSPKLMREFSCMIRVFFLSVQARSEQSLSLSSVRDLMLPKLLSGQIQIPEVDRLVAEAL